MVSRLPEYNNKEKVILPIEFSKNLFYSDNKTKFTPNYLQRILLKNTPNKILGKIHRRAGADTTIEMLALWGAYCNPNYKVYIVGEIGQLFENILKTIEYNKFLENSISSIVIEGHRTIKFTNGSRIRYNAIHQVGISHGTHQDLILVNNMEYVTTRCFECLRILIEGDIHREETKVLMLGTPFSSFIYGSDDSQPFYNMWIGSNRFLKIHLPVTNDLERIENNNIPLWERILDEQSFQAELMAMFKTKDGYV